MKKTVQIVTVPINKVGWDKNDLLKLRMLGFTLAILDSKNGMDEFEAQQLLVFSDDEIQPGDWCTLLDSFGNVVLGNPQQYNPDLGHTLNDGLRKTIAAYPSLTGILPLSKETIQEWIDNVTPRECSVEMGTFYTGFYIGKCKNCSKEFTGDKRWYHCKECSEKSMITDSQGNLILEFDKKPIPFPTVSSDMTVTLGKGINKESYAVKQIPTDVEIEEKAEMYSENTVDIDWNHSIRKELLIQCEKDYISGYKQALKDLGYSNEK